MLSFLSGEVVEVGVILLLAIDKARIPNMRQKSCGVPVSLVPVRNILQVTEKGMAMGTYVISRPALCADRISNPRMPLIALLGGSEPELM